MSLRLLVSFLSLALVVATLHGQEKTALTPQNPDSLTFKWGETSLSLTKIAVVAGEPGPYGALPEKTLPLPNDQLLPPNSGVWVTFDYETNFKKSDAPNGPNRLIVGAQPAGKQNQGYTPAVLGQHKGTAAVGLSYFHNAPRIVEIDDRIKLIASSFTNAGKFDNVVSERPIGIKCRFDGVVTLSLTQYKEIQATIQKVAALEKRVQSLEKGK